MLFSEFKEATGCKDTEYNHKVYRDLEVMYMNSNISKMEIYAYGRKLVDNSKTEEEIRFEKQIQEEIKRYRFLIADEKQSLEFYKSVGNKDMQKYCRKNIKAFQNKIRELKWVMEV